MLASSVADLQLRALRASVLVMGREMRPGLTINVKLINSDLLGDRLFAAGVSHQLVANYVVQ